MTHFQLALVTGATSGIGKDLCYLLAEKGINLIVTGRNEKVLEELKQALCSRITIQSIVADLSQQSDRQKLIHSIHQFTPDLVINNAGFGLYGEALTYQTNEQVNILEVNGVAVLELTLEAARSLIAKKKKGIILNVSSAASFQLMPILAVYSATKSFVTQVSQMLDIEMEPYGVRVLTACPGMIETDFQERAGSKKNDKRPIVSMTSSYVAQAIWKQIEQQQPLKIIDWKYKIYIYLASLIPKRILARFIGKEMNRRLSSPRTIKTNT